MPDGEITRAVEPQTSPRAFPTWNVLAQAVLAAAMLCVFQHYLRGSWTVLGALVGAAIGAVSCVLDWKAGGYVEAGLFRAERSTPLSMKWALVEAAFAVVAFGLVFELVGQKAAMGLGVGALVAGIGFMLRWRGERRRHAVPKPIDWRFCALAGVGLTLGLILGGAFAGLTAMWMAGFTGMVSGAGLGAILHAPKWACWGGLAGFVFIVLLIFACVVMRWSAHPGLADGSSWRHTAVALAQLTFLSASLAAGFKMGLPERALNEKREQGHGHSGGNSDSDEADHRGRVDDEAD
ncbi:MAG: hypothetical protein ACYTG0_46320 [Planctomycetota bacterium]|jgi:hypothetical protein